MSTSKLKIIDDTTFEYDGCKIAIELLKSLINPKNIPSAWMRVVYKDPESKCVTITAIRDLNELAEDILLNGTGREEPTGLIHGPIGSNSRRTSQENPRHGKTDREPKRK